MRPTPPEPLRRLSTEELARIRDATVSHYDSYAESFREGTKDHDVSQNIDALLRHIPGQGPHAILDVGCGPGRDLMTFLRLGHRPVGLDVAAAFVRMARERTREMADCEVWQQDLLALDLPEARFDGVFANAVLFHVPSQELPRVLGQLHDTLVPGGILFSSNPRGPDVEEVHGLRYGCYLCAETWRRYLEAAGFDLLEQYYRPKGKPREQQPWLATVWRRG
jgi:SAM-dependent methyltransferase